MIDEPENATLRLLRDLRIELQSRFEHFDEQLVGIIADLADLKHVVAQIRSDVGIIKDQMTEVSTRLTAHSLTLRNLADIAREREV